MEGCSEFSSLLCQEDETCLINQVEEEEDDDDKELENRAIEFYPFFVSENEDEYIENLVLKESYCFGSKGFVPFSHCSATSWFKAARLDSIDWIFNASAEFGFRLQTAYLSIAYYDRFLSKRSIDDGQLWAFRLLSVACLSLAAKMEEIKVPSLSEFQVQDYDFESRTIQRMELLVLSTLEWKLGLITPFPYLHNFINKFCCECESRPKGLVSGAIRLIVGMTKAAAILALDDGQLTKNLLELKMSSISFWHSEDHDHIYSCYNLMQNILERKDKTPPKFSLSSSYVLPTQTSTIDVLENTVGTKRRLTFSDSDDLISCPTKKIHMP
ncbi:cyclin-D5-1 isoform X2 [Argentina anserina]|uniref:cyclin-D5-1 isoform X2 n=1 Tax=Argentina anserina TaxID=57926 RepID=UPI0021765A83|nr:cyclin-D5-1 isoform X2 [Potentilla anserina]